MKHNKFLKGSEWNKWDLHIHTPMSIIQYYGGESRFDDFVSALENLPSEVKVIGATDYYFIDGYERLINEKKKGRLSNIEKIFPILEFRIDTFSSASINKFSKINLHILFDVDEDNLTDEITKIKDQFIERINLTRLDKHKTTCLSKENFIKESSDGTIKSGFSELVPNTDQVFKIIISETWKDKTLTFLGYKEWNNLEKNVQLKPFKSDLYEKARALFTASVDDNTTKKEDVLKIFGEKKLLHSSDIHNFEQLKQEHYKCFTWIKSEPTFEGLKQALYDPEDRFFIGAENPGEFSHSIIDSFSVSKENNNFFFKDIETIYFNPGLNCVIGPRGSGKSTLLDAMAFCLGNRKVIDPKRNNYTGFFFEGNDEDIIKSQVKHSFAGENKDLLPTTARDSGFLFDYYHQKEIGDLADPKNEDKLSRFLFKKIFQEDVTTSSLFFESEEQRGNSIAQLAVNRQKIVAIEKEILKEEGIETKIKERKNRTTFLSKPAIKNLLDERNKIIKLDKKIKDIKARLENVEEEPLVGEDDNVDTDFFRELLLSEIDPEGTVLPERWKSFESEINTFLELLKSNKEELETKTDDITNKVIELESLFNLDDQLNTIWQSIETKSEEEGLTITKEDLGRLDSIQKEIISLEEQLARIQESKEEKQALLHERKRILDNYIISLNSSKSKLDNSFIELLRCDGSILNNTITLKLNLIYPIDTYLECIQKNVEHDSVGATPNFPNKKSLRELFNSLGSEKAICSFRDNDFSEWAVPGIGDRGLDYFRKIMNKEEVAMHLEELLPSLTSRLLWRPDPSRDFKQLRHCSIGERGTALLSVILVTGKDPLLIDQPEDDLDHFYLYKTLNPIIKEVKNKRQLIFATHDANIVVNGGAELICIVNTSDGLFGQLIPTTIEDISCRGKIMDVLEGGEEAFENREKKYGFVT